MPPADRLREARRDAGYVNATAAAEAFGWVKSTYHSHENGHRGLPSTVAERYAKAFRVDLRWLLTGEKSEAILPAPDPASDARPWSPARKAFAMRLRVVRTTKFVSFDEFAAALGISAERLEALEAEKDDPTLDELIRLSERLGDDLGDWVQPWKKPDGAG